MIIDDLVRGSIDMHCHHSPAIIIPGGWMHWKPPNRRARWECGRSS